jgi:ABC-type uncharacterized transport system substrate-binding protein
MRIRFTVLSILLLTSVLLHAHPHVFIDFSAAYDPARSRLQVTWVFDEMSSQLIALDYDANRNGRFEPREAEAFLGDEGYAMLFRRGHFFIHPESAVDNVQVRLADNRVRVTFDAAVTSDTVGIWDEEYMFAFQILETSNIAAVREDDDYYGYTLKLR